MVFFQTLIFFVIFIPKFSLKILIKTGNMKRIYSLFILLLITTSALVGQTLHVDEQTKKITYSETVSLDTLSKQVLFDRAKKWVATKCEDKKPDVMDFEKGEIKDEVSFVIQLTYDIKYKKDSRVTFDMKVDVKDGKYRYVLDNFRIFDVKSGPRSQEPLEGYYAKLRHNAKPELVSQVDKEVKTLIDDFKQLMEKGEIVKNEDW